MAKTYKHLHEQIYDFNNLYRAYERARLGKRYRPDVLAFASRLGENLLLLQQQIKDLVWQPGPYLHREVQDPKRRTIHIAPFKDRVVHQAICEIIAPLFERGFIYDSYACRIGKGSHAAVNRLTQFLRCDGSTYVLKGDLRKFFDSLPHELVMKLLRHRIADPEVLELLRRIVASYKSDIEGSQIFGPRGVPIGNLTSQWFANIVGDVLDQYIKQILGCRHYLRYMDDWLLLSNSKDQLRKWLECIKMLLDSLGLVLNPKTTIFPTRLGVPFLGYRVWPDHRRILRANVILRRRKMRSILKAVTGGSLSREEALTSLHSWFAHLAHADTYRLRLKLWYEAQPILGGNLPC